MLIFQSVGYMFLSRYFANRTIAAVGCIIGGAGILSISFTSEIWQLAISNCLAGAGFGTFLGAYINVPNAYIMKFLPASAAQARTIPTIYMAVGSMAGPQVVSRVMGLDTAAGRWLLRAAAAGFQVLNVSHPTATPDHYQSPLPPPC